MKADKEWEGFLSQTLCTGNLNVNCSLKMCIPFWHVVFLLHWQPFTVIQSCFSSKNRFWKLLKKTQRGGAIVLAFWKSSLLFLIIHPLYILGYFFLLQKNAHPGVPFPSNWLKPHTQPGTASAQKVKDVRNIASLPILLLLLWGLKRHSCHKSICAGPLCKDEFYFILNRL